jgi:hypothetical protein
VSRVPSSPHFFRPVGRAALACLAFLLAMAWLVPAPLEMPADPGHPPNPAKSAWFLVWMQELVSYGTAAIYVALALAVLLVALPWLPLRRAESARWLRRELLPVNVATLLAAAFVLVLTLIGLYFRGANWAFVPPF